MWTSGSSQCWHVWPIFSLGKWSHFHDSVCLNHSRLCPGHMNIVQIFVLIFWRGLIFLFDSSDNQLRFRLKVLFCLLLVIVIISGCLFKPLVCCFEYVHVCATQGLIRGRLEFKYKLVYSKPLLCLNRVWSMHALAWVHQQNYGTPSTVLSFPHPLARKVVFSQLSVQKVDYHCFCRDSTDSFPALCLGQPPGKAVRKGKKKKTWEVHSYSSFSFPLQSACFGLNFRVFRLLL